MTSRQLFLDAASGRPTPRPPVWLMRQAGRYLPEYRELKADTPFMELCRDVDRCTEISLQPIRRFGMDAVIFFCDILVPLQAMGLPVTIEEKVGPRIATPVRTSEDVRALRDFDPEDDTGFALEILRRLRKELGDDTALLGFAGAPWTTASYAIEGRSAKDLWVTKTLARKSPELVHELLGRIADSVARYLNAQIAAGVDAVQLFDTWAGDLAPHEYREFAARYHTRVFEQLPDGVPRILYVNGCAPHLSDMAEVGADVLSIDWRIDLAEVRRHLPQQVLQGNVDPTVLLSTPERVREEVRRCMDAAGSGGRHIMNLGHGVLKPTPPEHVGAFVEEVKAR